MTQRNDKIEISFDQSKVLFQELKAGLNADEKEFVAVSAEDVIRHNKRSSRATGPSP